MAKKIDKKTRRALDTISYGDVVRFNDCFETQVYGDKTFRVISENPIITNGKFISVRLQGLGWVLANKLVLAEFVSKDERCDQEVIKALQCCDNTEPDCENCPYNTIEATLCHRILLHDSDVLIRRREKKVKGVF